MKKYYFIIITAIIIILAAIIDLAILHTKTLSANTSQYFIANSSRSIHINGATDSVALSTISSDDYYRIESGNTMLEGKYIAGSYFENQTNVFPTGQWLIKAGGDIAFSITSETPVTVSLVAVVDQIWAVVLTTGLLAILLILFVWAIVDP